MNQPDQSDENQVRRSQRFKWLVLGGFALLVSATLLGVLLIPWDVKPPIAPDLEFKPLELKPAENAFTYFEAAGKMPVKKSMPRDWYGYVLNGDMAKPIGSPDEQWNPALVGEILAENTAVLAEVEKGLACQRYASPVIESGRSLAPWMASPRMLVSLLFQKSKQRHLAGDYAGATDSGIQMLRFGWLMVDNPDSFLEWHYGVDYERMALVRFEELAADAKIPDPVLREIQAVLDHWDPQGPVKGFRQAIVVEYGLMRNSMMEFPRRDFENSELVWAFSKLPYAWKPNMIKHLMVSGFRNFIANADRPYATRIAAAAA